MPETEVKRSIGIAGVVVTLVGFVIGVSIFILPGALAATAGPAVIVSYAIAGVMALFSCFVAAQVGAVFPTSGASFVAISRLLSPVWGFVAVWFIIGGVAVAIALLAYGFADYAQLVAPVLDRVSLAILIIVALVGLNLLGVKGTVIGQGLMVVIFMAALVVFCTAGLISLDADLLVPFMPNGLGPVLAAAVPAFFSFSGFMVVICLLGLQATLGVAALLIPRRLPELYRRAGFRLGPVALPFFSLGLVVLSVAFLVVAAWGDLKVVLVAAAFLLVGMVYYRFRRSALEG